MIIRLIKERFKRLQKGRFRQLVALVATVQQSFKYRSIIHICVDSDGDWHNCRPDVTFVSPVLNVSSYEQVAAAVKDLWCHGYELRGGDTVLDVGAGIGDDVVVFSRLVGLNGRVIAIEAHPTTFRCLEKTIKANNLLNVKAINIAASDREGEVSISDGENHLANNIFDSGPTDIRVRGCQIDVVFEEEGIDCCGLIKMNIEGAEASALLGMNVALERASHLVISCHDFIAANHGGAPRLCTSSEVIERLNKAGYRIDRREGDPREEVRDYIYGSKLVPRNCDA